MQNNLFRVIFIGDVVGRYGRRFLGLVLPTIKNKYSPDVVIANGENAAGGLGIIERTAEEIFSAGVDVITGGNHMWDKKEAIELLDKEPKVIKPINYPESTPGNGSYVHRSADGSEVLVVSLQGRVFMEPVVDNPFLIIKDFINGVKQKMIVVDFHAEATAEKEAMGYFLNGRVSAVLGTHTHVPTSDARLLSKGTAYQTDVGMTGSLDSVIGMRKRQIIEKFLSGINRRFEVAKKDLILDMTMVDISKDTGRAVYIEPFRIVESRWEDQLS